MGNTWVFAGLDAGNFGGTIFTSFENHLGRNGRDMFYFEDGARVSGYIEGREDIDTLEYSRYTTDVQVNLLTGAATGVGGGVRGIENVIGGSGHDLLVGDTADNALFGNAGRDLLIGGAGSDRHEGRDDDDLLIGGTTWYDLDSAALLEIMDVWRPSSGLTYEERVDQLMNAGTPGGYFLNPSTVYGDGAADTLLGQDSLDWFFADELDTIDGDLALGEQLVFLA